MNDRLTYLAMFEALDCVFWENQTEGLRMYLSEANPLLWADRRSADPAVENEFDKFYRQENGVKDLSEEEAYDFVCRYLTKTAQEDEVYCEENTDLCEAFQRVTLPEWVKLCGLVKEKVAEGWAVPKQPEGGAK